MRVVYYLISNLIQIRMKIFQHFRQRQINSSIFFRFQLVLNLNCFFDHLRLMLRDHHQSTKNNTNSYYEPNSTLFLKRLQQNLEDLSEQLQQSNAKNIELTKLIKIVTEERDYYNQELKKSQSQRLALEEQLRKQKIEMDSKTLLITQLKKANRQLVDEFQTLNENFEETKFLFDAQQQQIERIRKQKQLIESEWSKVIKQVNSKMSKIEQKQEEDEKQNMELFANLPLKEKVKKALKRIDREIKEEENYSSDRLKNKKNTFPILKQCSINNSTSGNDFLDDQSCIG